MCACIFVANIGQIKRKWHIFEEGSIQT
jgi:hypothetical protein